MPSPIGQKGYTGNPGGRPKIPQELKDAFKALSPVAVERLKEILNGEYPDAKVSDMIKAIEIVLDRHLGKATQPIDADISGELIVKIGNEFDKL